MAKTRRNQQSLHLCGRPADKRCEHVVEGSVRSGSRLGNTSKRRRREIEQRRRDKRVRSYETPSRRIASLADSLFASLARVAQR